MTRATIPSNGPDAPAGISRRAMLETAGLAATAAFLGPGATVAEAKDKDKDHVVPAPVYAPTPYHREIDLTGKQIVITGASRGIGRATALELVAAGATVWGTSRTPLAYPSINEYPLLQLDLEDPASITSFVPAIATATSGRVDVLINNAGRIAFGSTTPLDPADFVLWATNSALALQTLYLGHRMLTVAMLGLMQHPGYRRIMFTASANAYLSGPDIGSFFYQPYVAGKRAIQDFANSLRAWFSAIGLDIGVGAVNPANTQTDLAVGNRPIFTESVDASGNPVSALSPLNIFLPIVRGAVASGQPASVVARAYRQQLELASPYPNVFAVIPDGPNSTAEAATLPLMLATREKEEQQFGAMPWAVAKK